MYTYRISIGGIKFFISVAILLFSFYKILHVSIVIPPLTWFSIVQFSITWLIDWIQKICILWFYQRNRYIFWDSTFHKKMIFSQPKNHVSRGTIVLNKKRNVTTHSKFKFLLSSKVYFFIYVYFIYYLPM